ncbi:hypothetical protein DPMN_107195 [Dreissena polymorpha]|uniref:protein-tyrosine-phosphatase n=1 Tax=Dreissena polymorpha TaxID=45954 RepID=A0A9D4QJX3_DREPO|nr:hypothetical protein DPMN_107195 [Dreissena polymorpha]
MSPNFIYFYVSAEHPGVVDCREFSDSPVVRINLRKVSKVNVNVSCDNLPYEMFAKGLDLDHQWYLFENIRPTEEFVGDFWRMIWQKKCSKIIMLTRLVEHNKVKCCQYWPDDGQKMYGAVTVEVKDTDTFSDYTIRTFVVSAVRTTIKRCWTQGAESRLVKHFHLESWSDRHVPEYPSSVIHFFNMIRHADIKENNVPILVHCSAGIGRTGTFLGLDYLLDQANAEGYINVFQCVQNLRSQRVNMVQNQDQYVFLHEAVAEALFCPSIAIHSERFPYHYKSMLELEPGSKTSKLEHEFGKLQHVTKYHESLKTSFYESEEYIAAKSMENAEKNRTRNILPNDSHRPFLSTRVEGTNDYINAVFLSSYRNPKCFLVTQNPLSDTIVDFWRMVYEYKVCTIITLDRITKPSEIYWPVESETITYIPFQLQHVTDVDHVTHIERTIKLTNAGEPKEKALLIKQYECRFWRSDSQVPVSGEGALLAVYEQAQKWQAVNGSPPIVAHCLNGSSKSGLFCVVTATIDRLKHEREVTLQHTLKQMRVNRHQIIPTYEQYRYCHDVIMEYMRLIDPCIGFGI